VDTGDLLYSRVFTRSPNSKKIGDLKANLYMKTYNLMGYDVFTPGELDLSFGVDQIIQMGKQANFPFVAANLMDTGTGKPVFNAYVIKEVQGIKVGLLGLISRRYQLGVPPEEKEKFYLADPGETGKKVIAELKKKCQVIAVLGHMEADEQETLARAVPDIHFILSGHVPHYQLEPVRANHTQIFFAGSRGEHLGQVDFLLEENKVNSRYLLVSLTSKYADHSQTQEWLGQYKTDLTNLLRTSTPTQIQERPPAVQPELAAPPTPAFKGERTCLSCHLKQHRNWLQTDHARAYQTLVRGNKASDPTCLTCHTTGFGAPRKPGARLLNVQCESCHGPGEGHPEKRKSLLQIDEDRCLMCHNRANSPNFDYDTYLQKIRHPN